MLIKEVDTVTVHHVKLKDDPRCYKRNSDGSWHVLTGDSWMRLYTEKCSELEREFAEYMLSHTYIPYA